MSNGANIITCRTTRFLRVLTEILLAYTERDMGEENKGKLSDSQISIDKKQAGNSIHLQIREKSGGLRGLRG